MTQFEFADLFANHFALSLSIFTAFISATSALLVATYFASHSISSKLARVIIVIYVASAVFFITAFQRNADILVRIRNLFDESMSWHTAATEPVWILPVGSRLSRSRNRIGSAGHFARLSDSGPHNPVVVGSSSTGPPFFSIG